MPYKNKEDIQKHNKTKSHKESAKKWRLNNPNYNNEYYKTHKEQHKIYQKKWNKNNKEKIRLNKIKYRNINRDEIIKKQKEWCHKRKQLLIDFMGGKCQNSNCSCIGGYNRSTNALEFHHIDPTTKESKTSVKNLSNKMINKLKELYKEGKIKLLCSNCHKEISWI